MTESQKIQAAAEFLRSRLPEAPELALVLGSGLGGLAEQIKNAVSIPYRDVPYFPLSTAPGHAGQFVAGRLAGRPVLCMQGRFHYYEGHEMSAIARPVRVFKALGCRALVLTNAAGGVNYDFQVGDFMLITDHINFMGANPLRGENEEAIGPRFCDMSRVYDAGLQEIARQVAAGQAFRTLGADAVGMSTVPEAIAAAHCGLPVLAMSLITNMAAGMTGKRLSGEEVIEIANQRGPVFQKLVAEIVAALP